MGIDHCNFFKFGRRWWWKAITTTPPPSKNIFRTHTDETRVNTHAHTHTHRRGGCSAHRCANTLRSPFSPLATAIYKSDGWLTQVQQAPFLLQVHLAGHWHWHRLTRKSSLASSRLVGSWIQDLSSYLLRLSRSPRTAVDSLTSLMVVA